MNQNEMAQIVEKEEPMAWGGQNAEQIQEKGRALGWFMNMVSGQGTSSKGGGATLKTEQVADAAVLHGSKGAHAILVQ